jgi:hypothetical protein
MQRPCGEKDVGMSEGQTDPSCPSTVISGKSEKAGVTLWARVRSFGFLLCCRFVYFILLCSAEDRVQGLARATHTSLLSHVPIPFIALNQSGCLGKPTIPGVARLPGARVLVA